MRPISDLTGKPDKYLGDYAGANGLAKLEAALTDIGSDETRLQLDAAVTFTADKTIPTNVTIFPVRGCLLTINEGIKLTINGHLEAGPYKVFDNSANAALLASDSSLTVTITHSGTDQTWTRSAGTWSANYVTDSLFTAFGANLVSVNVGTFVVVSGAGTSALVVTNPNAENGDQSGISSVNCYGGDLSKGVKFGYKSVPYIKAEWFGAVANDTAVGGEETANFQAFNFAMNATIAKNVIPTFFVSGNYYINGGITCGSCSALGAFGASLDNNTEEASMLNFKNSTSAICISGAFKWIKYIQMQMGSVNTRGILVNSVTPRCAEIEYNFIYGQYAENTDNVYKIYIAPGSEQTKTRFNRVQGPGGGIYDAGDGGQTHLNEVEGSGQLTTGIYADGSSCSVNQVQYHKYGFHIGTNGPRLVRNIGQQCMIGFYAPAARNLDMDGCGAYSNYTFGILALGLQNLNLVNNKFAGNLDGSLCYSYGTHITGYGNIFDDYINDSARHYKTPSVVPDPLGIGSYNFTYANLFDNLGLDLPYVNQNGVTGINPFNYYQITGLNCTFNVGYSTSLTVTVAKAGTTTWVRSSGSWVTDGFVAGMDVDFTGFANPSNNDRWRIVSIGGAGNNTLTTSNSSQFGRDSVEVTNDAGITAQGQPVLTRDSGGSGDWDTDFPTSGVLEGDCIHLGGNWPHIQNTRHLLTANRVAANAIYFITPPGGTAGMSTNANESVSDSSGMITHVPLIHGKRAVINSPNSGKVIDKFLNNAPGSSLTLTLNDGNVGFAKWAAPEVAFAITHPGAVATATLINGNSSPVILSATAAVGDGLAWYSEVMTGGIQITTSQAFDHGSGGSHTVVWQYWNGAWTALPGVSLNDPWSASPGIQTIYFKLPSDAVPIYSDDSYTTNSKGRYTGYAIRSVLSAVTLGSGAAACNGSTVLKACWMRLGSDTIAAPGVGETKVLVLQNNANIATASN